MAQQASHHHPACDDSPADLYRHEPGFLAFLEAFWFFRWRCLSNAETLVSPCSGPAGWSLHPGDYGAGTTLKNVRESNGQSEPVWFCTFVRHSLPPVFIAALPLSCRQHWSQIKRRQQSHHRSASVGSNQHTQYEEKATNPISQSLFNRRLLMENISTSNNPPV